MARFPLGEGSALAERSSPSPDAARTSDTETFPAAVSLPVVIGAACWALSIAFFVNQAIVQAAFIGPYELATNVISDLGNTACGSAICSPLHRLMNVTFIVVGAFHWLGAITTLPAWPRRGLGNVGRALLALAGVGLIVVGAAPENVYGPIHAYGALVGLVSLNLGMIVLGLAIVRARRWLGLLALGAGIVGFVGLLSFLSGRLAPGVAERLADYPGAAMIVVFGVVLLAAALAQRGRAARVGD
ncbi:MAG: DUF998 domain-containing protein [Deinococcales bacterium]